MRQTEGGCTSQYRREQNKKSYRSIDYRVEVERQTEEGCSRQCRREEGKVAIEVENK